MKAVIPAAGKGTRFLPATRAVPKVMLPLLDRPIVEYAVAEAAAAGIDEVVVVLGGDGDLVRRHFSGAAGIEYVVQDEPRGLGDAVATAGPALGGEPFVVLLPDEIVDPGLLRRMLAAFEERDASVIGLMDVPRDQVSAYGVPEAEPVDGGLVRIHSIVEKPAPEEAPSTFATIGRYVFTPEVLDSLAGVGPGYGGEIQLTDAIDVLARKGEVYGVVGGGARWDVGTPTGMLRAAVALALVRDDLRDGVRAILRDLGTP